MTIPILATKLFVPLTRPEFVPRPRLIEQLNEGLHRKLILVSAPAGFGKTTLVGEWIEYLGQSAAEASQIAWLSLDERDNDPARFLVYLVTALQTVSGTIGEGVLNALQSPQPPPPEVILTALLNDLAAIPDDVIFVLDDYHLIDSQPIDAALTFLVEHLPPQIHLIIATREDPSLPLARLRARNQLAELRAADLRFTSSEAAAFLNQVMGLSLSAEDVAALETRTEGWIAGLQLAAISMQGHQDTGGFIRSFTGSHHFVMDYLVEEVLHRQPASVQNFLLSTSILDRLCGPLCDAVLLDPAVSGQETLEYLMQSNLFIIPLDNERRWYRYHHLFADLLRQRIAASTGGDENRINELHIRASRWYEDTGMDIEAFHHAAAANDIDRAARLLGGKGIPRHFRGVATSILNWLKSLPVEALDARPVLWWRYASLMLINGQTTGVDEKLAAAEAALQEAELNDSNRNLIGHIAGARATLALTRYQADAMITQSRRALEYLHPDNLAARANANWSLGYAYLFLGDRTAALQTFMESVSLGEAAGDTFTTIIATVGVGNMQELQNQLYPAAETYRDVLQLASDQPLQIVYEAHLGLARILYEWNDLDAAEEQGQQSLHLARQYDQVIDRFIVCEVFLARLKLAQGDVEGAAAVLAQADQSAHRRNFVHRIPEVAAAQVITLLHQGEVAAAAQLAEKYQLPISQARVSLAQGDAAAALAIVTPLREQAEAKGWPDERLRMMVLQAVAYHAQGETDSAGQVLGEALELAAPGGFIRTFIDEGPPMADLLTTAARQGIMPDYTGRLLAACEAGVQGRFPTSQPLIDPLSERELEILRLVAEGLSNQEIGERLFLALDTVKGHNRRIFDKLQVQRRTEAVARARELGLL